jgi:hypothetical protein
MISMLSHVSRVSPYFRKSVHILPGTTYMPSPHAALKNPGCCSPPAYFLPGTLGTLDALCDLIFPDADAPAPAALDRGKRGRQAHDRRPAMPSKAEIARRIAASGEVRAARAVKAHEALLQRFPALKNARVGG